MVRSAHAACVDSCSRGTIITHSWACKDRVAERVGQIMLAEMLALVSDSYIKHGASLFTFAVVDLRESRRRLSAVTIC